MPLKPSLWPRNEGQPPSGLSLWMLPGKLLSSEINGGAVVGVTRGRKGDHVKPASACMKEGANIRREGNGGGGRAELSRPEPETKALADAR